MAASPALPRPDVYRRPDEVSRAIARSAEPFDALDTMDLGPLLDRIGGAEVVLLGEATHGTREFYRFRARLTRALVEHKGFRIVAVEADWPDAERVDAYVRHRVPPQKEWAAFERFPAWMWRNAEVLEAVEALRTHNAGCGEAERVGFYGLDLYSLYTSLYEVLRYLDATDAGAAEAARGRYGCLEPFREDPARYGRAVVTNRYRACEAGAVAVLTDLLRRRLDAANASFADAERLFDAAENARVVADAERYYRTMYYGSVSSWNLRDAHMFETLQAIRKHRGQAKAVVWAHNSHLGDAAFTEMGWQGETNLGHLCREAYGQSAYLVGFGTHTGSVLAAHDWGGEGRVQAVQPSLDGSYERLFHDSGVPRLLLPLRALGERAGGETLRRDLWSARLERAIGVVYRPDTERQSHYFEAALPGQFDEYVWFDETTAVTPLGPGHAPALSERHPLRLLAD